MGMSLDSAAARPPRARAVGDAPVEALLDGAEELAKRWAIALVLERPLAEMPLLPLEDLAREAPGLCMQLVRALQSDVELERLASRDQPHAHEGADASSLLATLADAMDAKAAAQALEALRGVLWEAILGELRDSSVRQVAELSDRLAFVCATALGETLAEVQGLDGELTSRRASTPAREHVLYTSAQPSSGRRAAILIDEHEDALSSLAARAEDEESTRSAPVPPPPTTAPAGSAPAAGRTPRAGEGEPSRATPRPLPWDTPLRSEYTEHRPPEAQIVASRRALYDEDPVMRVTRGAGSPVDERR